MVGARSAAMAFNRLVDAEIDARNPRTKIAPHSRGLAVARVLLGLHDRRSLVLLFAAWELNPLCFRLAPLALAVVFAYSFTKRFTHFSHLVLGFALGIAPAAAWIAVRGSLDPRILWLTAAVTFWTAGFDIIYSCQDYEFDSESGCSACRRLRDCEGAAIAKLLHVGDDRVPAAAGLAAAPGSAALAGIVAVAGLLIYEHGMVKPTISRASTRLFSP